MRNTWFRLMSVLIVAVLLLSACGTPTEAPATEEPMEEEPMEEEPAEEEPAAEEPAGDVTEIRWFIGLGAGGNPEEQEKENAFVEKFNADHDEYELVLDIVPNETAYDVLKTQIASGDVPDIVGPVGVRGLWSFEGAWLTWLPTSMSMGMTSTTSTPP